MLKKLFAISVLALGLTSALAAGGCASDADNRPNGLTGNEPRQYTPQEIQRYSDQKGHFHAEWVGKAGH